MVVVRVLILAVLGALEVLIELLALQEPAEHKIAMLGEDDPVLLLVLIPLSLLVIDPGEELLFRGVIQPRIVNEWGIAAGILITSAFFALTHLGSYQDDGLVVSLDVFFALSLIVDWLYEYTGNLVVTAFVQEPYNTLFFLGLCVAL